MKQKILSYMEEHKDDSSLTNKLADIKGVIDKIDE